jgi:Ca-activated chloride channel family protein
MITMSQETGGKYYYANAGNLDEAFRKVSEDLRTQYLLGYYPDLKAEGPDFRSISVMLTHAAQADGPYSVQNRAGYYADAMR